MKNDQCEVSFYHLSRYPVVKVLPKLLEKIYQAENIASNISKIDNTTLLMAAGASLNLKDGWETAKKILRHSFDNLQKHVSDGLHYASSESDSYFLIFEVFDMIQLLHMFVAIIPL